MSWVDVLTVIGGFVAGLLSGAIGIGGGLLFVPILTVGFRAAQPIAQGTSLLAIIPTALVGGITHIRHGNVLAEAAIWMAVGGVVGAVAGALVAVEVPDQILTRVFGAFLLISAGRIAWTAWRSPAQEHASPTT